MKIRAIGRSDLYNFMGFCKANRGDQSTWFMRDNFETFKTLKILKFDLIVRATEAVDRSDFSNVSLVAKFGCTDIAKALPVHLGNDR